MCKRTPAVMALAVMGFLAAPGLGGQAAPKGAKGESPESRVKGIHDKLISDLKLTEKQAGPVREIFGAYRRDMAEWMHKYGPEIQQLQLQMKLVHEGKHKGSIQMARAGADRLRKLQAEQRKKTDSLMARLKEVLNEKQLAQVGQFLHPSAPVPAPQAPLYLLKRIGLTQDQWARIRKILDAAKSSSGAPGKTEGDPMREAWDRIAKEVLTDKDRQKLEAEKKASHRRVVRAMLGGVEPTEEQYAKINQIWKVARQKAAASPGERIAIYQQAQKEIIGKVLTSEQREQVKKRGGTWHGGGAGGTGPGKKGPGFGNKPLPK